MSRERVSEIRNRHIEPSAPWTSRIAYKHHGRRAASGGDASGRAGARCAPRFAETSPSARRLRIVIPRRRLRWDGRGLRGGVAEGRRRDEDAAVVGPIGRWTVQGTNPRIPSPRSGTRSCSTPPLGLFAGLERVRPTRAMSILPIPRGGRTSRCGEVEQSRCFVGWSDLSECSVGFVHLRRATAQ
ncbi:hypothetical protein B0H14DRAFT_2957963 [Mycena olivaceomarginata]|nr:hypothetical protein B0H14DRAFT_2957963 [Mycena olivaceomarginata]